MKEGGDDSKTNTDTKKRGVASSKRFQPHVKNDTRIGGELASSQLRASNRKREIASTAAPLYSERINS